MQCMLQGSDTSNMDSTKGEQWFCWWIMVHIYHICLKISHLFKPNCCPALRSHLATWFTTGAKLVGPYSCTVLRLWWYASKMPSIPLQYGFSMFPFWKGDTINNSEHSKLGRKFNCVEVANKKYEIIIRKWNKRSMMMYQWELMWHPSIRGQFGSKAESGEHLVAVVVLNDLPNSLQSHGVCVELVGVHVVQGRGLRGVTCWPNNQSQGHCGWWGTKTSPWECNILLLCNDIT